jgi:hypothetical protein
MHSRIWVGIPEGKRPLRRSVGIVGEIIFDLEEIWWEGVDWINLAQEGTSGRLLGIG